MSLLLIVLYEPISISFSYLLYNHLNEEYPLLDKKTFVSWDYIVEYIEWSDNHKNIDYDNKKYKFYLKWNSAENIYLESIDHEYDWNISFASRKIETDHDGINEDNKILKLVKYKKTDYEYPNICWWYFIWMCWLTWEWIGYYELKYKWDIVKFSYPTKYHQSSFRYDYDLYVEKIDRTWDILINTPIYKTNSWYLIKKIK